MELVHDLCVTAFVAILLSFLVAKLVSMAMASDGTSDHRWGSSKYDVGGVEMEEIEFEEKLLHLEGHAKTPKRVRFAEMNNTERVYQFSFPAEVPVVSTADDQVEFAELREESKSEVDDDKLVKVDELREGSKSGLDDDKLVEADELRGESHSGLDDDKTVEVDELRVELHSGNDVDELIEVDELREKSQPEVDDKLVDVGELKEESQSRFNDKLVGVDELLEEKQSQVDDNKLVEEVVECGHEVKVEEENCDDLVVDKAVLKDEVEERKDLVRIEEPKVQEEEKELVSDEDWEGIERSQLEKDFAAAAAFIGGDGGKGFRLDNIESDVQMQLYGLHKVAMEGPCREPQPMALKMSARAKWNAWQKMGNMNPDVAMEQYMRVLSDRVPGWNKENSSLEAQSLVSEMQVPSSSDPNPITSLDQQDNITNQRKPDPISDVEEVTSQSSSTLVVGKEWTTADCAEHSTNGGILLDLPRP